MTDRIIKTEQLVKKEGWDALIVDAPIDIYYLTGLSLSLGRLIVQKNESFLFVDGRYFEACKEALSIPVFLTQGYGKESSFQKQFSFSGKKIAFDSIFTSYKSFQDLEKSANGQALLIPIEQPITKLRERKEPKEIQLLKEAAQLSVRGFQRILQLLKSDISEEEIAMELELFWRKNGGDRLAFDSIIAFQENASKPHHRAGKRKLKKGEIIQIDIGVCKNNYASDMSRVVAYGTPHPKWKTIYEIVFKASQAALALCRPGVQVKEVDLAARELIAKAGFGEFFNHGLGHGVGLEVHELPVVKSNFAAQDKKLESGMVITIEPGIYLPQEGGIRLEDTIVITENGYENLTALPLSSEIPIIQDI